MYFLSWLLAALGMINVVFASQGTDQMRMMFGIACILLAIFLDRDRGKDGK